jgi:hypothetical protein
MKILILLLHLLLLAWMFFSLSQSGTMSTTRVFLNFFGMAVYGALLIVGTANWAKKTK